MDPFTNSVLSSESLLVWLAIHGVSGQVACGSMLHCQALFITACVSLCGMVLIVSMILLWRLSEPVLCNLLCAQEYP